jgi:hypothetical protein
MNNKAPLNPEFEKVVNGINAASKQQLQKEIAYLKDEYALLFLKQIDLELELKNAKKNYKILAVFSFITPVVVFIGNLIRHAI